jgi:hypothetical protein
VSGLLLTVCLRRADKVSEFANAALRICHDVVGGSVQLLIGWAILAQMEFHPPCPAPSDALAEGHSLLCRAVTSEEVNQFRDWMPLAEPRASVFGQGGDPTRWPCGRAAVRESAGRLRSAAGRSRSKTARCFLGRDCLRRVVVSSNSPRTSV